MRLPEQMRRTPLFDIRSAVHDGLDFDLLGHFTPLFDGIAYVMVPRWANVSSVDDLRKVKIVVGGQEIDFSGLDLSRIDQSKLNNLSAKEEKPAPAQEEIVITPAQPPSWFGGWFGGGAPLPPPPPATPSLPPLPPAKPLTRNRLLHL